MLPYTDTLQMQDEHYDMVMTFNALSKELYSLKQESRESVAEFRGHLSQQVQKHQLEYLRRIQQEHIEEMKWDHFYKGLNLEYQCMLANKMDGKYPTTYSDLLLAAGKLERWWRSQRSSSPEDHYNWRIKCCIVADIREFISL